MMKTRWCIYLLIGFFSLAALSASISAVTGAQPREVDDDGDDDEAVLDDPLPDGVDMRLFIHRPRVLKPNHLGTCVPSVNAKVDHFEFMDRPRRQVIPVHLPGPIMWRLNRSTVPSSVAGSVDSVLNQSFNTWYTGVFFQGPDTDAMRARLDGVNAILWKRLRSRRTVGKTVVWYSRGSGEVLEVDTVFNSRFPWAIFPNSPDCQSVPDAYDVQNIATHEFGHWIGLDDLRGNSDRDLTMYAFGAGGELKKRTLGAGDISGKNALQP